MAPAPFHDGCWVSHIAIWRYHLRLHCTRHPPLAGATSVDKVHDHRTLNNNGLLHSRVHVSRTRRHVEHQRYGSYVYTAPTAVPKTGNMISITVISEAGPTKSSNLVLTLH